MIWLLDTNVLIHAIGRRPRAVVDRYDATAARDMAVWSVPIAELWYGVARDANPVVRRAKWESFLAPLRVLDFDRHAAVIAGEARRSATRRRGLVGGVTARRRAPNKAR